MKKRIIAFLLSCMVLMTALPSAIFAKSASAVNEKVYTDAHELLSILGVAETESGTIDSTKITRYGFVSLMVKLYEKAGIMPANNGSSFSDMTAGSQASVIVGKAEDLKLIHGDDGGTFRPNDNITLVEAMTVALNALGYNKVEGKNAYSLASAEVKNNLMEHVVADGGYLTYSDAYMLINNALNENILFVDYSTRNVSFSVKDGETLIKSLFGIIYEEGVMTANEITHIKKDSYLPAGSYEIETEDGEQIVVNGTEEKDYSSLLGLNVGVYYRENTNELVYVTDTEDNAVFEIDGDDVLGYDFDKRRFNYNDSDNSYKEKYVKINTSINVVYNSYYVYNNADVFEKINDAVEYKSNLNIRNVKFLDNNGDGEYDIMFVNMYRNFLVGKSSAASGIVSDYYTNNTLNLKDNDLKIFIRDENGNKVDYTTVVANSVLSIEEDLEAKHIMTIYRSNISTEGVLQGKRNDSNGYYFTVNDQEMKLANGNYYKTGATGSPNYLDYIKKLYDVARIGDNYTVYYDICGKVTGFNATESLYRYGYVLKAWKEDDNENQKIKIVVPDDSDDGFSITTYDLKSKVKFDGVQTPEARCDLSGLAYKPLRFKADTNNEINDIDTPSATKGQGQFSYLNAAEADGPVTTKYRPNYSGFVQDNVGTAPAATSYFTTADTVILVVPKNADVEAGEESIARLRQSQLGSYFTDWRQYEMNGMITDESEMTVKFLVTYLIDDNSATDTEEMGRRRPMVVDKVYEGLNHDGETAVIIEGMSLGARVAYASAVTGGFTDFDNPRKKVQVNPGDILLVKPNVFGDAKSVRKLYNFNSDSYGTAEVYSKVPSANRVVIGSVFATDGRYFSIVEKSNPIESRYAENLAVMGDHRVYVYDADEQKVTVGSYNDITAGNDTRVVVRTYSVTYNDFVIYKNVSR